MAKKSFATYLEVVSNLARTPERDLDLENMVQFLLVKFNHIYKRLRPLADYLLSKLMDKFSYLLWSEKTLRCLMDITELLASSLNMDTNQVAPEFALPNTNFKLKVLDNLEGRESTVNDFTLRCSSILQEGLQFAPITAKSHIQNYMLQLQQRGENIYDHSGASMMLECVMKHSRPRADTESLDTASLHRRPDCVKKDFSNFIGLMNEKYNYVGIVQGLCKNMSDMQIVKNLCQEMRTAYQSRKQKELKDGMLKSAAFLTQMRTKCGNSNFEREILHELSICCSSLFSKQTIQVAIECWSWIISSRPDTEPLVVEEMINAWQMSVDLRLGMFNETLIEPNPLAKEEKDLLRPNPPPNIDAHRIWIKYFQERLDIAKYKSDFEIELFFNLMHKTLSFTAEKINDSCLNRHVSCVGLRFRFLVMALSLLQSSNTLIPNTVSKCILRERIYYTALDYFTMKSHVPTQTYSELREDLRFILEFWNRIVAEKKYLKEENFNFNAAGFSMMSSNGCVNGGQPTPDGSMTGFNLDNPEGGGGVTAATVPLGTSVTYNSSSGMSNLMNGTAEVNPASAVPSGGALSQLVLSSNMFMEPSLVSMGISANNGLPGSSTIARAESTMFNNGKPSNPAGINTNSHVWINTLSKKNPSMGVASKYNLAETNNLQNQQLKQQQQQRFLRDYFRKRNLLLYLVSHELDHLYTFHNPFNTPSLSLDRIQTALGHLKVPEKQEKMAEKQEKQWAENVRCAWSVSPELAVFLASRFPYDAVVKEVQTLVKSHPERCMHIPEAATYLATEQNILNDSIELNNLLVWSKVPALVALNYFGKGARNQSLATPITAQFASKNLMTSKPETLLIYIAQLVQALRYDDFGYAREVIFWLARHSQLLAHQLIWNMTTNVYRDQDAKIKDPQIGDLLELLIKDIKNSLTGPEKEFFRREFEFFQEITDVSAKISCKPLGDERKKACELALKQVKLVSDCYLPSNPDAIVVQILDGTPMQSAAKAPYLARFVCQRIKLADLEVLGKTGKHIQPNLALQYQSACIFKVGDDCRQDMLALQIMTLLKNVFELEGLELFLFPYRVIATKPGCGVIECVPNSNSRDQIGRKTDIDLYQYFIDKYGGTDTSEFQRARRNFIMSMAGYSLFVFLIQIKDRHNGNLMLDEEGHIIHIDFGFMIESSPGGNMGFEPDMKITTEMGLIMGGDLNSPSFQWFTELCIKGYLAIRPYRENILTLVALLIDTGLPCFRGKSIETLRARFQPSYCEREAAQYMQAIVHKCYNNWRTNTYDGIQYMQNSIYKPS